jgi:hypothetical protein
MSSPAAVERNKKLPLSSVTPLYGLSTDTDRLVLTDDVTITRISEEQLQVLSADDVFIQHIRLYQPQHLPWKTVYLTPDQVTAVSEFCRTVGTDLWRGAAEGERPLLTFVFPVSQLLRAFQLFKPGRLVAGDTSFFVHTQAMGCTTLSLARCSEMSIDFQFVQQFSPQYQFKSEEVPFFLSFFHEFHTIWPTLQRYPQIDLALHRYAKESAMYGEAVDLIISLEALLVPEEEGIAYRLSQRVANLLGADAATRKELFRRVRECYGLRSKIVHGAKFKQKEISAAQQLDWLREIARRVLLSVMALAAEMELGSDFYASLNDMCFDDDLRRSIQAKASRLLHC